MCGTLHRHQSARGATGVTAHHCTSVLPAGTQAPPHLSNISLENLVLFLIIRFTFVSGFQLIFQVAFASAMEAAQVGGKEEKVEEKAEEEEEEEEEKALGRREWLPSCDKSVICDRGPGLVRLGSSLRVGEEEEEEDREVERERRRRRKKMGEKEKGEAREGHRLSVVLPRQRARSPVTVQVYFILLLSRCRRI